MGLSTRTGSQSVMEVADIRVLVAAIGARHAPAELTEVAFNDVSRVIAFVGHYKVSHAKSGLLTLALTTEEAAVAVKTEVYYTTGKVKCSLTIQTRARRNISWAMTMIGSLSKCWRTSC